MLSQLVDSSPEYFKYHFPSSLQKTSQHAVTAHRLSIFPSTYLTLVGYHMQCRCSPGFLLYKPPFQAVAQANLSFVSSCSVPRLTAFVNVVYIVHSQGAIARAIKFCYFLSQSQTGVRVEPSSEVRASTTFARDYSLSILFT